jgi:hypothetical protein
MSSFIPKVPDDGEIYTLKGCKGSIWWDAEDKKKPSPSHPLQIKIPIVEGNIKCTPVPVPAPVPTPKKHITKYLLIVAGQSNAQSSNNGPLTEEELKEDPRLKAYYRGIKSTYDQVPITNYTILDKGVIGPAIDPLQHHGISNPNSVGFWRSFCMKFLEDNPDSEITIVPCALGGTGFRPSENYVITWDKSITWANKNLYSEMIESCNSVLKAEPEMKVLGTLWHQGENDIGLWSYKTKLNELIINTRLDLLDGRGNKMPFICGTMLASWKALNQLTNFVDHTHKSIKWSFNDGLTDCAWFDWIKETPHNDGMNVHFNAVAQRFMGMGYYATFKKMKTISPKKRISGRKTRSLTSPASPKSVVNSLGVGFHPDMDFNEICRNLMDEEGEFEFSK